MADAHQQGRHGNLHRHSAIPGWINRGTADVLNTASDLARSLQFRGVSAGQLYTLLEAIHTIDLNSDSSIERSNQEVERPVAEHIVVGHAPCTRLAMDTLTICQQGCSCQENLPNGSCCQTYPRSHTVQHHESRQECTSKDREARAWAKSGPYSRGRNHCSSTAAGERQAEETEAGPVCRLCGQEPAASDLGYPECWECFFGMHR